jgi:transposase
MTVHDLKDIYRRLREGQSIRFIRDATGFDRKTIRLYRESMTERGLLSGNGHESDEALMRELFTLLPSNERPSPIQDEFQKHRDEIIELISRKEDPLKPKTAFLVVQQKYELSGSYESFKLFARKNHITLSRKPTFPRIEYQPGQETQIDYCKCGLKTDPATGKRRVVHGFIAKLSASRLPYVEFTYSQNQESFVESNVRMVEHFGGVTEYLTIDNLKAGVIKADVYDPQLNRSYAEFAEHYGTFINACIPGHAKGKAKVERQVQEIRELFRRLNALHPTYSLQELNREAAKWCLNEYGMKRHGTTGIPPREAFENDERTTLKPLAPVRFEVPVWKAAKVHQDQFLSFDKKRFSLPPKYRRQTVYCRRSGPVLTIYDANYLVIRQYVIKPYRIHITDGDFPEDQNAMMQGQYPQYLISRAAAYGPGAKRLVESVLRPHAFLNARRALGIIDVVSKYSDLPLLQDVCAKAADRKITSPKQLKIMLEDEQNQHVLDFVVPRSSSGEAMVRDVKEYFFAHMEE